VVDFKQNPGGGVVNIILSGGTPAIGSSFTLHDFFSQELFSETETKDLFDFFGIKSLVFQRFWCHKNGYYFNIFLLFCITQAHLGANRNVLALLFYAIYIDYVELNQTFIFKKMNCKKY
jgi:hypothetical protein